MHTVWHCHWQLAAGGDQAGLALDQAGLAQAGAAFSFSLELAIRLGSACPADHGARDPEHANAREAALTEARARA